MLIFFLKTPNIVAISSAEFEQYGDFEPLFGV